MTKELIVTVCEQKLLRNDWMFDFRGERFEFFFNSLAAEMLILGVEIKLRRKEDVVIQVNSYADLLNVVRVSSPQDGHNNQCVGHIIGKSRHLDILEDVATAVRRVAFAPETIPPSTEFRKVCHNCGCGC